VSGRVVDERGEPVEGATIRTDVPLADVPAPTDADGRFELTRLHAQPLRISTGSYGLLHGAEATVDGTYGDVSDVVLAVVRGGRIDGTVAWPDGAPAEDFRVTAHGPSTRTTIDSGDFELRGLAEGRYHVEAHASRDGVHFQAAADDVPLGSELALVLVRSTGAELQGTVVDAAGEPVADFQILATRSDISAGRSADGSAGGFRLTGLEPGPWKLAIHGEGYRRLRQEVEVGATNAPLRIELVAATRIRGTVVDPSGVPVAGATVVEAQLASLLRPGAPPGSTTDARGAFDVEANAERVELVAASVGFAASAPVAFALGPGESAESVVLVLRDACRVEGRVLDENGRPVPHARVMASDASLTPPGFLGTREANADGDFVFDALPPGNVQLFTSRMEPSRASAAVTVESSAGQVTRAELRF
jgi:protocatechuate 3,4-dioxygenase beta subunit